jgi:hypothetical protein
MRKLLSGFFALKCNVHRYTSELPEGENRPHHVLGWMRAMDIVAGWLLRTSTRLTLNLLLLLRGE